jgi:hypothetical protein
MAIKYDKILGKLREKDNASAAPAGNDSYVQYNDGGVMGGEADFTYDDVNNAVKIGQPVLLPDNPLAIKGDVDSYLQTNLQNVSDGENASVDYIVTADTGDDTQGYGDLGICNSQYAVPEWDVVEPIDTYVFADGGNVAIGSLTPGKKVKLFVGQTIHEAHPEDVVAEFDQSGMALVEGSVISIGGSDIRQADFDRHSPGLVSGGTLSTPSAGNINIDAGSGWAWDGTQFIRVSWDAFTNQAVSENQWNYVAIDYEGNVNISTTEQSTDGYIRLGHVYKNSATGTISPIWNTPEWIGDYPKRNNTFLYDVFGTIISTGLNCTEQATPNKLTVSSGTMYSKLTKITFGSPITTFKKVMYSTDNGLAIDENNDNNTIDTTKWNDPTEIAANALKTMTLDYWAKALIILSIDGQVMYVYPQTEYETEDEAKEAPLQYADIFRADQNALIATIVFKKSDASVASRIYDIRPMMSRAFGTEVTIAGGSVVDHGSLIGLADDDHSQYHTDGRADTWLSGKDMDDIADGTNYHALSTAEQTKLSGIATGAEVNVQADWNQADSGADSYINNKPTIPAGVSPATTVVSETSYSQSPVVGVATTFAREDHSHGTPTAGGGGATESFAIAMALALG